MSASVSSWAATMYWPSPRPEIGEPAIAAIRDEAALVDQQRELGDPRAARQPAEPRHLVVAGGVGRADELLGAGGLGQGGAALERPRRVDQRAGDRRVRGRV